MKLYEVYVNLSYVNNLYIIINKYLISMNIKRLFLLYLYTIFLNLRNITKSFSTRTKFFYLKSKIM